MQILISQPMKGKTKEQIQAERLEVVNQLTKAGHTIIDSVFDFKDIDGIKNTPLYHLAKSLELIATHADAVFFMKGWQSARGCRIEHQCCFEYGITTLCE